MKTLLELAGEWRAAEKRTNYQFQAVLNGIDCTESLERWVAELAATLNEAESMEQGPYKLEPAAVRDELRKLLGVKKA